MMPVDILLALSAFAFVSSITPGPNNLMLMTSGVNFGFARTVPHMLGVAIGFTAMIVLVGVGLVQIFETYPLAYDVMKAASIAYLLYLAWKIAMAAPPEAGKASGVPISFVQAAMFQWVNPKAWTMALTALVSYAPKDHQLAGILLVAAVFGVINLPCVGVWALVGVQLRRLLDRPVWLRAFNIGAALLLVGSLYPVVFSHGPAH